VVLLAAEVEQRYEVLRHLLAVLDEKSSGATGVKVPRAVHLPDARVGAEERQTKATTHPSCLPALTRPPILSRTSPLGRLQPYGGSTVLARCCATPPDADASRIAI
jgi:hypothetical protein